MYVSWNGKPLENRPIFTKIGRSNLIFFKKIKILK
jgi:hypothetical protein